jgi:hypothetical protein
MSVPESKTTPAPQAPEAPFAASPDSQEAKTEAVNGSSDPLLILIYGPSGIGKTTDCGYSFPNALFISAPGALQSIKHVTNSSPRSAPANVIGDITKMIVAIAELKEKGLAADIDTIVIDDFSYVAEQTFAMYEAKKLEGFKLWGALRDDVIEFRNAARHAKVHIVTSTWEQAPKQKPSGARVKGGPMLSGNLPEQLPAMFDMVLRCSLDPLRKPWPGVYLCSADPNYTMKDRLNITSLCSPAPMNLGELMRAANYKVSRLASLSWQEPVVEKIAKQLVQEGPTRDKDIANQFFTDLIKNSVHPAHARWTLRDALDRATIRRALSQKDTLFLF